MPLRMLLVILTMFLKPYNMDALRYKYINELLVRLGYDLSRIDFDRLIPVLKNGRLYPFGGDSEVMIRSVVDRFYNGGGDEPEPEPSSGGIFAGLKITSGPLYYNGTSYNINGDWSYNSYGTVYGKNKGSTYFSFIEIGQLFEKEDFSKSDGDIDNLLNPLGGWRLPTIDELKEIFGTSREGSTVNGNENKHYAFIEMTGITFAESNTPRGILLFPDGAIISGRSIDRFDNNVVTRGLTANDINDYVKQGCSFIPFCGQYSYGSWKSGGNSGYYLSNEEQSETLCYVLQALNGVEFDQVYDKRSVYMQVYLVKEI